MTRTANTDLKMGPVSGTPGKHTDNKIENTKETLREGHKEERTKRNK